MEDFSGTRFLWVCGGSDSHPVDKADKDGIDQESGWNGNHATDKEVPDPEFWKCRG
jgi:hypothetical protein